MKKDKKQGFKLFDCLPDETKKAIDFIKDEQIKRLRHKKPKPGQFLAIFAPGKYNLKNKYFEVVKFDHKCKELLNCLHVRLIR